MKLLVLFKIGRVTNVCHSSSNVSLVFIFTFYSFIYVISEYYCTIRKLKKKCYEQHKIH